MKEKSDFWPEEKGPQATTQRMESAGLQPAPPSAMEGLAWALSWSLVFQKAQRRLWTLPQHWSRSRSLSVMQTGPPDWKNTFSSLLMRNDLFQDRNTVTQHTSFAHSHFTFYCISSFYACSRDGIHLPGIKFIHYLVKVLLLKSWAGTYSCRLNKRVSTPSSGVMWNWTFEFLTHAHANTKCFK